MRLEGFILANENKLLYKETVSKSSVRLAQKTTLALTLGGTQVMFSRLSKALLYFSLLQEIMCRLILFAIIRLQHKHC